MKFSQKWGDLRVWIYISHFPAHPLLLDLYNRVQGKGKILIYCVKAWVEGDEEDEDEAKVTLMSLEFNLKIV